MNTNEITKKEYVHNSLFAQIYYRLFINYKLWPLMIERIFGFSMRDALTYNNINRMLDNPAEMHYKYRELIFNSKYDKIEELIKDGVIGVDEIIDPISMQRSIHYAVLNDDSYMVEKLSKLGANITARDIYGQTPLLKACSLGYLEVIKTLLDLGSPLGQTEFINNKGMNCYDKSVYHDRKSVVEYLDSIPKNLNIEKHQYWLNKPLITKYNLEVIYHRKLY